MNKRQPFWKISLARSWRRRRRQAAGQRHRRIWCEILEPRLALAAPVAINDTFPAFEDVQLLGSVPGVLANDTDADGDTLTALLVQQPPNGAVALAANGSFTYTPVMNFHGFDSFTYRASDGTLSSLPATVTIHVAPVNDFPFAVSDSYAVAEDTQLSVNAPGLLLNDIDVDGDLLTAQMVTAPFASQGFASISPNGSFTFTPVVHFHGQASFIYRVSDIMSGSLATVTINVTPVNDAPQANNNAYTLMEDTPLSVPVPGVLINDFDIENDQLTAQLVTQPTRGTLTLNANGGFQYLPSANFHGIDSFTYRASDGLLTSNVATVTLTVVSPPEPPIALDDSYTALRNSVLNIAAPGVLTNDADVDSSATLAAHLVTGPSSGTLVLNPNGSFTFAPPVNVVGPVSFSYRNSDGQVHSNIATVTINFTFPPNTAPVVLSDAYNATEDTPLTVPTPGILSNDLDADGDVLHAVLVSGPTRGTVSLNVNGGFVYTPAANFHGLDSFRYCANDGQLDSGIATVTINVAPVNDPPVARDDAYSVVQNVQITVPAHVGLLSNDTDADGDQLTTQLTGPTRGTLTLNANGSFVYLPNPNAVGIDSFTYRATDGALVSNVATVRLQTGDCVGCDVTAVNDAYAVPRNTALNISAPGVLTNDMDGSGSILNATLVALPANGALVLNPNGSFSYTPAANFTGLASFTYRSSNGHLQSNLATVTINVTGPVNTPPFAVNDFFAAQQNTPLTIAAPGVLFNDFDLDNDPLTSALVTPPASGTLTLNPSGSFSYVPAVNFLGQVSFTYRLSDGIATSNLATVTLSVCPGCSNPPQARSNSYTAAEDTPLVVPAATGILADDVDFGGAVLMAELLNAPTNGSLSLQPNGSFTYTPPVHYFGDASFTYRAFNGQLSSTAATVTISVTPSNDFPIATADTYSGVRNLPLTINAPGVLANDVELDGDALLAELLTSPLNGVLSLASSGRFTYTPTQGFMGLDSFTYRASDGLSNSAPAIVRLNIIIPCATCPGGIQNDAYTLTEDVPLSVPAPGVLANDGDPDYPTFTAQLVTSSTHGTLSLHPSGSFSYTPQLNFFGLDSFTYRAFDGQASSNLATVTLTITPVNDPPLAFNDNYVSSDNPLTISSPGLLANDVDAEGDSLIAALVTGPAQGTLMLNSNGSFNYVPENCFNGVASFTYRVSDGVLQSTPATVSISISTRLGAPPVLLIRDNYVVNEDTPLAVSAPGVLTNDYVERCLPPLTAQLVVAPARGTLTFNPNGSFLYTPFVNYSGPDSFVYRASDGLYSDSATVTITIAPINDPPIAGNDQVSALEDVPLTINVPGVLANDSDADSNPLAVFLSTLPTHGTVSGTPQGAFTYIPHADFNGTDSFTYFAHDGLTGSTLATVTITVAPVNDPPTLQFNRELPLTFADDSGPQRIDNWMTHLAAGPPDELGQPLTLEITTDEPQLFAEPPAIDAAGRLTFIPARNMRGVATLTVVARDADNSSSPLQTINLAITKPFLWHNTALLAAPLVGALDVDGNGAVSPLDAILVINHLNSGHPGLVPADAIIGGPRGLGPGLTSFLDTAGGAAGQGDNVVAPLDAILVINWLNARSLLPPITIPPAAIAAEGESVPLSPDNRTDLVALLDLLALDVAQTTRRRRLR